MVVQMQNHLKCHRQMEMLNMVTQEMAVAS